MTPHQTPPSVPTDEMVERAEVAARWLSSIAVTLAWRHQDIENAEKMSEASRIIFELTAALAAERARVDEEMLAALKELDRWSLVISAALNQHVIRDPRDADQYDAVTAAFKQARAAIAQAEASRLTPSAIGAEGWRPIESAPKDRLIDLWLGDRRWSDCYFDAICREWRTTANSGHLAWAPERAATHWMERPTPPTAQEG